MAYIEKRGKAFRIRISQGYNTQGKRVFISELYYPVSKTESAQLKEVEKHAQELEIKIKNGEYFNYKHLTLNEFYKKWRDQYASSQLSVSQFEKYCSNIERVFLVDLGALDISKITALHLQEIISKLEKQGLKAKSIKSYFSCFSSMMNKAFSLGIIKENPCKRVTLPKIKKDKKLHTFNEYQAKAFLSALERVYYLDSKIYTRKAKGSNLPVSVKNSVKIIEVSTMWKAFFTLALFTGARRGELISLTWNDIDFINGSIKISKSTAPVKNGQVIKEPKTASSNRTFTIPFLVLYKLQEWKKEQMLLCEKIGSQWQGKPLNSFDDNFIFIQNNGSQMYVTTPTSKFKEILTYYNNSVTDEKEKLPMIRLHDLRHTSASLLIGNGEDIASVSALLGHSRISVTLDTYTHAIKKVNESSVKLARILDQEEQEETIHDFIS